MRRHLYAVAAGLVVIAAPAAAADLPTKAPAPVVQVGSWTGFYLGGDVGFRSAVVDPSTTSAIVTGPAAGGIPPGGFNPFTICAVAGFPPCPGSSPLNNTAFRAGIYGGYNYQLGSKWVVGIEGDVGFADATRTLSGQYYPGGPFSFMPIGGDSSFSVTTKWDASVRARAGILITPSLLAFVSGGPAWIRVEETSTCGTVSTDSPCVAPGGNFGPVSITNATTRTGWTIGGGLEGNVWGNWLARAEYRYANYGTWTNTDVRTCGTAPCFFGFFSPETFTVSTAIKLQTHTALFGLAYKFGAAPAAGNDAYAADIGATPFSRAPAVAAFSWTGFHLGGDVGVRSSVVDASVTSATLTGPAVVGVAPPGNLMTSAFCLSTLTGPCPGSASLDNTAFRAGVYAGYDYQIAPRWVVGLEGDWAWADRTATLSGQFYPGGTSVFVPADGGATFSVTTKWDASVRARAGFLVTPSILPYVTAGASWLHAEETSTCGTTPNFFDCGPTLGLNAYGPVSITNASTRLGWTVGGGLEANIWGQWLARAEYRYADYGDWGNTDLRTCPSTGPGCLAMPGVTGGPGSVLTAATSIRLRTHTASFGLGYKF